VNKRVAIQIAGAAAVAVLAIIAGAYFFWTEPKATAEQVAVEPPKPVLDTAAYDAKLLQLAHIEEPDPAAPPTETDPDATPPLWPTDAVYPNVGAILPFNRIVAYYGNFYSTGMGILGQYQPEEVVRRLQETVKSWEEADPNTPVIPGIDYIAVTAQYGPGEDGMYRARMPFSQIDKAVDMAKEVDGIVILEVQAGLSDVLTEVKQLEPYLVLPQVNLAIDPEFAMNGRGLPGRVVGTVDAEQINDVAEYLAELVRDHDLSPKILIVHRYTQAMVTNADKIEPLPEVQIVMDMDGWGPPAQKFDTYNAYIYPEPVQFTGFKLFYKNDVLRPGSWLLTPAEVLELVPQPIFIQYQ